MYKHSQNLNFIWVSPQIIGTCLKFGIDIKFQRKKKSLELILKTDYYDIKIDADKKERCKPNKAISNTIKYFEKYTKY